VCVCVYVCVCLCVCVCVCVCVYAETLLDVRKRNIGIHRYNIFGKWICICLSICKHLYRKVRVCVMSVSHIHEPFCIDTCLYRYMSVSQHFLSIITQIYAHLYMYVCYQSLQRYMYIRTCMYVSKEFLSIYTYIYLCMYILSMYTYIYQCMYILSTYTTEMPLDVRKIDAQEQRHLMAAQDAAR